MLFKADGQPLGTAKKGIGKLLLNAQRLLESLCAVLEGFRKAAGKCRNTQHQPMGEEAEFSSSYQQKSGNSPSFPLKCYISVYINKKDTLENFKNSQRLLSL
jgi:hypothetical protein